MEEDLIKTQNTITQFPDRIGEIYANYHSINVNFPMQFKIKLDSVRREILPTIDYHHTIKSDQRPNENEEEEETNENSQEDMLLEYTEQLLGVIPHDVHSKVNEFLYEILS